MDNIRNGGGRRIERSEGQEKIVSNKNMIKLIEDHTVLYYV